MADKSFLNIDRISCPNCGSENSAKTDECSICFFPLNRIKVLASTAREAEKKEVVPLPVAQKQKIFRKSSKNSSPEPIKESIKESANTSSKFLASVAFFSKPKDKKSKFQPDGEDLAKQRRKRKTSASLMDNSIAQWFDKNIISNKGKDDIYDWLQNKSPLTSRQFSPLKIKSLFAKHDRLVKYFGVGTISCTLIIWISSILVNGGHSKSLFKSEIEVPQGLFDYGGASFFASLVDEGVNSTIENLYPQFDLRYAKPLKDFSTANAIKQVLNGELAFAYNNRPLTEQEYQLAQRRGIKIEQTPIAIDGVIVYGNTKAPVKNLGMDVVIKIFSGELTNWKQIDGKTDLPIVPVLIENENYDLPGYDKNLTKLAKVSNYTQAVRQVIKTPGAISFASAALLKEQRLVKIFSLAEPYMNSYIKPFTTNNGEKTLNFSSIENGSYPFTRKLFLVTRKDGTLQEQAGRVYTEYLASEIGQKIFESAGFVPIYY